MKPIKPEDLTQIASDVIKKQVLAGFQPIKLTKKEKFALCFRAGVHMDFGPLDKNNITNVTTQPVGIAWTGRKFLIYYQHQTPSFLGGSA